ncbi:MAG TPA: sigma factor-like helix-turn-helix DNA-binding protein [Vulgatibacter sp.]
MARWATPDAAIESAARRSPLRARGQDPAGVPGTGDGAALALDAYSQVWAALGRLRPKERGIVIDYACGHSYRDIAKRTGIPKTTLTRVHYAARRSVHLRLIALGLVDP